LPSLANGAGLFLLNEIIEEKWAKLRMSQVKKRIYSYNPVP
jgi:hypothetical protein